jgi:hypothetical protein
LQEHHYIAPACQSQLTSELAEPDAGHMPQVAAALLRFFL